MGRTLPILSLAAMVLVVLGVLAVTGWVYLLVLAAVAIAAGAFCLLHRDPAGYASGALLIVLGIVSAFMSIGGVSTEQGGVDGFLSPGEAHAFALVVGLATAAALLWLRWEETEPMWVGWGVLGALLVAAVLVFVFQSGLGNPAVPMNYLIALLVLAGFVPGVLALRSGGDGASRHHTTEQA